MSRVTRRSLLLASTGAAASLVAGCDLAGEGAPPRADPDRFRTGSFRSAQMRGATVGWSIAYPPGTRIGDALPVVIVLHGRGQTHLAAFGSLRLGEMLDRVVAARSVPAFAIASIDGGDHSYYHRRADGTDAAGMLRTELVPTLAGEGLDTSRLGLLGWSMGGYGALLLAGRRQLRVRAVAAASPALFTSSGATPAGAFDDADDYLRNDVYGHPELLRGIPLRIDCGRSDPFYIATRDFVARLRPRPAGRFGAGGHDAAYWRSVAPAELAFLGRHLAA